MSFWYCPEIGAALGSVTRPYDTRYHCTSFSGNYGSGVPCVRELPPGRFVDGTTLSRYLSAILGGFAEVCVTSIAYTLCSQYFSWGYSYSSWVRDCNYWISILNFSDGRGASKFLIKIFCWSPPISRNLNRNLPKIPPPWFLPYFVVFWVGGEARLFCASPYMQYIVSYWMDLCLSSS